MWIFIQFSQFKSVTRCCM